MDETPMKLRAWNWETTIKTKKRQHNRKDMEREKNDRELGNMSKKVKSRTYIMSLRE